jgi:hypothetical protein
VPPESACPESGSTSASRRVRSTTSSRASPWSIGLLLTTCRGITREQRNGRVVVTRPFGPAE